MVCGEPETNRVPTLGNYQLLRRIAVGGMAEIFEARSIEQPARPLVLKVLLPQYANDPEFLRTIEDEAKVGMLLSHPNLVRMYEMGHVGSRHFLVMDLVDGIALSDLIPFLKTRDQSLPSDVVRYLIAQVLEALAYVHHAQDSKGNPLQIVHRDVTPHNILLSKDGQVRLGDFGIARSNLRDARTRTGVIKGKLRYLAPEQATGSSIDARTDLYAVGLILFELLTGEHYLEGGNEIELLRAAESPTFRAPSSNKDVDPRFDDLLRNALARFPEERYQNAQALLRALTKLGKVIDEQEGARQLAGWVNRVMAELPDKDAWGMLSWEEEQASGHASSVPSRPIPTRDWRTPARQTPAMPASDPSQEPVLPRQWPWLAGAGFIALVGVAWSFHAGRVPSLDPLEASLPTWEHPWGRKEISLVPVDPIPQPKENELEVRSDTDRTEAIGTKPPVGPARSSTNPLEPMEVASAAAPSKEAMVDPEVSLDKPLQNKLASVRSTLRSRGILMEDLSPEVRALFKQVSADLAAKRWDDASSKLVLLEREASNVKVDGPFVQRKMARVDRAVLSAGRAGADVSGLQPISARALQAYMEGRYGETNRLLNELLGKLAAAKTKAGI